MERDWDLGHCDECGRGGFVTRLVKTYVCEDCYNSVPEPEVGEVVN
jgi:hypothetical protein